MNRQEASAESALDQLCRVIRRQVEGYTRLLALAQRERQVLAGRAYADIDAIVEEKVRQLSHLAGLEQQRQDCVRNLASSYQLSTAERTLADIARRCAAPAAPALDAMRQELRELAGQLRQVNDANLALVERLRAYTHAEIALAACLPHSAHRYSPGAGIAGRRHALCDGLA